MFLLGANMICLVTNHLKFYSRLCERFIRYLSHVSLIGGVAAMWITTLSEILGQRNTWFEVSGIRAYLFIENISTNSKTSSFDAKEGLRAVELQTFGYHACHVCAQLEHVFSVTCLRLDENDGINFFSLFKCSGFVHTTPELRNLKTEVSLWKHILIFFFTQRRRIYKRNNQRSLWIRVWGRLGQGNHVIIATATLCFQNVFCPHGNKKLAFSNPSSLKSVFELLRFRDGLVWHDGRPTVEIKLLRWRSVERTLKDLLSK